jgi:hypothetical protein
MTSIEILERKFQEYADWITNKNDAEQCTIFELFQDFEIAKISHKKEIKDAYNQGYREGLEDVGSCWLTDRDVAECSNAENYYNENFKK